MSSSHHADSVQGSTSAGSLGVTHASLNVSSIQCRGLTGVFDYSALWKSEVRNNKILHFAPQISVRRPGQLVQSINLSSIPPGVEKTLGGAQTWLEDRMARTDPTSVNSGEATMLPASTIRYTFSTAHGYHHGLVHTAWVHVGDPSQRHRVIWKEESSRLLRDLATSGGLHQIHVKDHPDCNAPQGPLSAKVSFGVTSQPGLPASEIAGLVEGVRNVYYERVDPDLESQLRLTGIAYAGLVEANKLGLARRQFGPLWHVSATPKEASWGGRAVDADGRTTVDVDIKPREPEYQHFTPNGPGAMSTQQSWPWPVQGESDNTPIKIEDD